MGCSSSTDAVTQHARAGNHLLDDAFANGSVDVLQRLLQDGSLNVNQPDPVTQQVPLAAAIRKRASPAVVATLLEAGARLPVASGSSSTEKAGRPSDAESFPSQEGTEAVSETAEEDGPNLTFAFFLLVPYPTPGKIEPLIGADPLPDPTALVTFLLERKAEVNARVATDRGLVETPLVAALKARDSKLVEALLIAGAAIDVADECGNTPLHVVAALGDVHLIKDVLARGSSSAAVTAILGEKNSDGHSPILCARLGAVAPERRLSKSWAWSSKEVLRKAEKDFVQADVLLQQGEEVWRCPVSGSCWGNSAEVGALGSPAYPENHRAAAVLALAAGDAYSLTDAVEGAWIGLQAPPYLDLAEVHPEVMQAITELVNVLRRELRAGLRARDAARLEEGLEMLRYARVAELPEEKEAVRVFVRIQLDRALESKEELELKQAVMSARQFGLHDITGVREAREELERIDEARRVDSLVQQLLDATESEDLSMLHALLRGSSGSAELANRPEKARAEAVIRRVLKQALNRAISTCNKKAVHEACARVEDFGVTDLVEYRRLVDLQKLEAKAKLNDSAATRDKDVMAKALLAALKDPLLQHCDLTADTEVKDFLKIYRDVIHLPAYFDDAHVLSTLLSASDVPVAVVDVRTNLNSDLLCAAFQQLFDMTHSGRRTKDRRGAVPTKLVVKEVSVVQNASSFLDYARRREEIRKCVGALSPEEAIHKVVPHLGDRRSPEVCKTFPAPKSGGGDSRPFHKVWAAAKGMTRDPIDPSINEFYLFHGTSPDAAIAITDSDFRIDLAGSNAGTLYGRGIYFAESCSKSDEYASEDSRGLNPMLLCRVSLGRIKYTVEEYPSSAALINCCVGTKEYHSVLGDREKIRNTFREMIVYDNAQAYPEFVIWYSREFT